MNKHLKKKIYWTCYVLAVMFLTGCAAPRLYPQKVNIESVWPDRIVFIMSIGLINIILLCGEFPKYINADDLSTGVHSVLCNPIPRAPDPIIRIVLIAVWRTLAIIFYWLCIWLISYFVGRNGSTDALQAAFALAAVIAEMTSSFWIAKQETEDAKIKEHQMIINEFFMLRISYPWGGMAYLWTICFILLLLVGVVLSYAGAAYTLLIALVIFFIFYMDRRMYNAKYRNPNPSNPCPLSNEVLKDIIAFNTRKESIDLIWVSKKISGMAVENMQRIKSARDECWKQLRRLERIPRPRQVTLLRIEELKYMLGIDD